MPKDDAYYRAMLARDHRFDGKFFVGVKTTGIYCRPICPARPRRENVEFFATARLAEREGYRPCLRCRPEAAPGSPAWAGKSAVVQRALKAIADQEPAGLGEEAFAARFGVGARHLRRLFEAEIGESPTRLMLEGRLDFARKLIVETAVPMAEIARTAGFASLRRFNAAIKDRFRRPPTALRRPARRAEEGLALSLAYRPPFDWEWAIGYYRSHAIAGLESFPDRAGGAYERVFRFGGAVGLARVTPHPDPARLRLQVFGGDTASLGRLARTVRRMFDLDSDPLLVANAFAADPHLRRLHRGHPGLRSPRGWDPFETAVGAILGQLVSREQANRLVAQLVEAYGEPVRHPLTGATVHLFPAPATLAAASLDPVGTTGARKALLREFSRQVAAGELSLDSAQDPVAFRKHLLALKGLGPWTAEYICLRALGDADAFPATDLVLKRALSTHPACDPGRVRPWRGYAAAWLWHAHAERSRTTKGKKP